MAERDDMPDMSSEYGPREVEWMKPGESLPEVLDPIVTKALIQQFVEVERNRNRRALLWISGIFLFVVLLILTMFLTIGLYVLNKTVVAAGVVEDMTLQTSAYAAEVVDMSNKLAELEEGTVSIKGELDQRHTANEQKEKVLKSDLVRFSKWVASQNKQGSEVLSALEAKMKDMETASQERQKEFDSIRNQYEELLRTVAEGGVRPAAEESAGVPVPAKSGEGVAVVEEWPSVTPVEETVVAVKPAVDPRRFSADAVSVVSFPNGDTYKGAFKNGLFSGWGVYTSAGGDRYEGSFDNDMKNGQGSFFYRNGDKYVGNFKNDMKDGQGTFYFSNGERYVGGFLNNEITGKGSMFYNNGNKHEGDFKNGMRHGNGVLTFSNGDIYKGEFLEDLRTGKGSYFFGDGSKYTGGFENGKRHGKGRYIYASGEEFIGDFKDGKREGPGLCIYPNGQRLNGLWKNDEFVRIIEE